MARVLAALAAEANFDAVVLGAWGFGVFRNDPAEVAEEVRALLAGRYRGLFRRVVFAVLDPDMCAAFEEAFARRGGGGGRSAAASRGEDAAPRPGQGKQQSRKVGRWRKQN